MRARTYKPQFESLETRQLMAGNVVATFTDQNLVIKEDPAQIGLDNAIKFSNLPGAITRVEGLPTADGTKTLINGEPFMDFQWVRDLTVKLGSGNDRVEVDPLHTPSYAKVL